ncbi:hypothetical protein STZ1_50004 [Bacillus subtilis]
MVMKQSDQTGCNYIIAKMLFNY